MVIMDEIVLRGVCKPNSCPPDVLATVSINLPTGGRYMVSEKQVSSSLRISTLW